MEKVRTAVIGTGKLGSLHVKMLTQDEQCDFVGIFDTNPEQAKTCADQFDVKIFSDLDELLDQVDAVSIAVITTAHYEIASKCLNKGLHVFIEKPITATVEEAEKLVALAKEKECILQVGHIERYNAAFLSVENINLEPLFIQSDRLAQFGPRALDVDVVHDLMIHDIDIILSLIKSPVKQIDASGVPVVSEKIDIANTRIQFENGSVANVTASRISQKKMRKMRIFQRDAYIALDFQDGTSECYRLLPPEENIEEPHIPFGEIGVGERKKKLIFQQPEKIDINALQHELGLFVRCVLEGRQPDVSGEDGLRALRVAKTIIDKINESVKQVKDLQF